MKINKRTYDNSSNSIFHSNGMAQAANGNSIGATGGMSFEKRLQIDTQRSVIKSYRHSALGARTSELRAKRFDPANADFRASVKSDGADDSVPRQTPSTSKVAPPPRKPYNPYA